MIDVDDLEENDYLAALQVQRLQYGLAAVYRFPAIFEMCVLRNNGWLTLPAMIPHIDYVPPPDSFEIRCRTGPAVVYYPLNLAYLDGI